MTDYDASYYASGVRNAPATNPELPGEFALNLAPSSSETDASAPVIDGFVPADGSQITITQAVQFDVTDNVALASCVLIVSYGATRSCEAVHDGTAFRYPFAQESTRTPITNGFRFVIKRTGGWPASPRFDAIAVDAAGNVS